MSDRYTDLDHALRMIRDGSMIHSGLEARMADELTRLRASHDALLAALRPFAEVGAEIGDYFDGDYPATFYMVLRNLVAKIKVRDLRRAAKALEGK